MDQPAGLRSRLLRTARRALGSAIGAADDIIFPWSCQSCGGDSGPRPVCAGCAPALAEGLEDPCPRCALPAGPYGANDGSCGWCRGRPLGFDGAVALGSYEGPLRDLCLMLKHDSHAWLAHWLALLLAEARAGEFRRLLAEGPAMVVPVPLHWSRRLARGYNQSEALARGLARALGLPMREPIRRGLPSPKLAGLSRTERSAIMKGAFRARRRAARAASGRTIILVDDVLTTGATCGAAARALKGAGASRVVVAAIGRTKPGRS